MGNEIDGEKCFNMIANALDERTNRLVASAAALGMKYGGISQVARLSGLSRPSIYAGMKELKSPNDKDFSELNIRYYESHPEWNYVIMHQQL